jgi:hypothetical protein
MKSAKDEAGFFLIFFFFVLGALALGVVLYVLAQVVDFIGCFCTCGKMECFTQESCAGQAGLYKEGVSSKIFGFLAIAGAAIGFLGGIIAQIQKNGKIRKEKEDEEDARRKEEDEKRAIDMRAYLKGREEAEKEAQEDRMRYAREFKSSILPPAIERCRSNMQLSESWDLEPTYEAVSLQRDVWTAINEASLPLQRLDDIVSELKAAGGKK